jgi:alkylhydroperoxidase/carboxymuconolactone decarboxylase family protein YurZ
MNGEIGSPTPRHPTPSAASCKNLWRLAMDGRSPALRTSGQPATAYPHSLDDKTRALVCLAALVATTAGPAPYERQVAAALAAGATPEDVTATLIAVAPTVGLARVVSATGGLARGLGYDIDAALEDLDGPLPRGSSPTR